MRCWRASLHGLVLILMAALTAALGCDGGGIGDDDDDDASGDDDSAADDDDDATGDDDTTASGNCTGGGGSVPGGQFFVVQETSAWLYVPTAPVPCAPLLMFGHGGGSPGGALDGVWDDSFHTELPERAEQQGFVFVVPGLEEGPSIEHGWLASDTVVLDGMIDAAGALVDIDLDNVIFAGTSSGGHMAAWYGLYAPERLSHVAVLSAGLGGAGFDYPVVEPDPKLPFYVGHDPDDGIVPYSYSEDLAVALEWHDHEFLFEDLDSAGENNHGWTPDTTDAVLSWWLGGG